MGIAELVVFVCAFAQESRQPTTAEVVAEMQADMRGQRELFEPAKSPSPPGLREGTGVTSVARLVHKVPKDAQKSFDRATKLAKDGKTIEAIEALEDALRRDAGFAVAHNNLGVHYYFAGRLQDAEQVLRRAILLDPAYSEAFGNLAVVNLALGNVSEAERLARTALALYPRNEEARLVLSEALRRSK